jgi:hypothetical protein
VQQITNAQAKEIRGAQTPIDDMLAKAKMQEGIKKLQETQKKTNNDIQKIKDKISNGSGSK